MGRRETHKTVDVCNNRSLADDGRAKEREEERGGARRGEAEVGVVMERVPGTL